MASKLQQIGAHLRAEAQVNDETVAGLARFVQQCERREREVAALLRGQRRAGELIGLWEQAARSLRLAVADASLASRRLREIAAELCGDGASPVEGAAGLARQAPPAPEPVGAPHGGHGGWGAAPARQPVEDISRDRVNEVLPSCAGPVDLPGALAALRYDWIDAGGHAGLRHDVTVANEARQKARCMYKLDPATGTTTDWKTGRRHRCGRDATAFTSRSAMVFAEAVAWDSEQGRAARAAAADARRYSVELEARQVFGPDFRTHIVGWERIGSQSHPTGAAPIAFPDDTRITVYYERQSADDPWSVDSMFPWRPKQ